MNKKSNNVAQKRILTIQDISCMGRCSLTVALPIISSCGIECSIIPTAILSTHTGVFSNYTFHDLTDNILPILEHWDSLGITFDAVYTGYLGSEKQLGLAEKIFEKYKKTGAKIIIDPVMGDNGELYKGFSCDFAQGMTRLCGMADVVIPNITEAHFLLEEEHNNVLGKDEINDLLRRLQGLGAKNAVITGISSKGKIGAACTLGSGTKYCYETEYKGIYHGTGDIFASALTAVYMLTENLAQACYIAAKFTSKCIERTLEDGVPEDKLHYGVHFEPCLPYLHNIIQQYLSQ